MLNTLLQLGYGAQIYDIDVGCPTFADDIELVALSPIGLHNMLDICFRYSGKWTFKFSVLRCFIMICGQLTRYIELKLGNVVIKETAICIHLETPLHKNSLENEIIESKIRGAYKKVWMLLSISSKNAQLNPLTFSKSYWSADITKLCYGLFKVQLKDRSREELDKVHINIAIRVHGLQPNAPAIVLLVTFKWTRLTTYIDKEAIN